MKSSVSVYRLTDGLNVELNGTIEDIRTYMKNLYTSSRYFIEITLSINLEEDYYTYLDNDSKLLDALNKFSLHIKELCGVPIEDFE